jgi:hypothetical protein
MSDERAQDRNHHDVSPADGTAPDVVSHLDPPASGQTSTAVVDRSGRGRAVGIVAAVAALALVVGTAGYAWGASSHGQATSALGGSGGVPSVGWTASVRPGAPTNDMMIYPGSGWHIVFSQSGLSDASGTAQAWAFDPQARFDRATAAAAAAALGLTGTPSLQYGSRGVGDHTGSGPSHQLSPDG